MNDGESKKRKRLFGRKKAAEKQVGLQPTLGQFIGIEDPPKQAKQSSQGQGKKKKKKKKRMPLLARFLIKLGLITAILAFTLIFVFGVHIHHENRMHPYLADGDLVFTYKLDKYRVGDVVAYERPDTGKIAFSRIVAEGDNEIKITDIGELLVNGLVPAEKVFYKTKQLEGSKIEFPYQVSADGYFVLDDLREIGEDSRIFGEVKKSALKGKVVGVYRRRGF